MRTPKSSRNYYIQNAAVALLILAGSLGCRTEPRIEIVSRFSKPVAGMQRIKVRVAPRRVEDLALGANDEPLSDLEPRYNFLTGFYTFNLDTTLLPNGHSKLIAEASYSTSDYLPRNMHSAPCDICVSNDISFGPVYDSAGKLVQEAWPDWFSNRYPIRASAIHYDPKGKVMRVRYTIKISDDKRLLRTLTGTSANGLICLDWDLRDENGRKTTDSSYDVVIDASWFQENDSTGDRAEGRTSVRHAMIIRRSCGIGVTLLSLIATGADDCWANDGFFRGDGAFVVFVEDGGGGSCGALQRLA